MANYDIAGALFDAGLLYDQPEAPSYRRTKMAKKVKFNLNNLPDAQIIQK